MSVHAIRKAKRLHLPYITDEWSPLLAARASVNHLGVWWLAAAGLVEIKTLGIGITLIRRAM